MVSYSFEGTKRLWTVRDEEENEKIFSQQSKPTGVKIPHDIKPTYLTNAQNEVEKWPLMRLLRFYAAHRCLWDVNCKDNRNRKMRQAAIVDITAALDTGVTKEQVVQKINILRATYRYEKKRIKQRIRRGLGARTKLKWFALADAFLRNVPKKGQRKEDTSNSDSDLEDTIVFTINPESFMLSEQELSAENSDNFQDNEEISLITKQEIVKDLLSSKVNKTEKIQALNSPDNKELQENNKNQIEIKEIQNFSDKENHSNQNQHWTLKETLKFLQLLQNRFIFLDSFEQFNELHEEILESIAKEMNYAYNGIKKRWFILENTYKEEKQKIKENPLYKPRYKWWLQAEKLLKSLTLQETKNLSDKEEDTKYVPTESIFLPQIDYPSSSDDEDYTNRFLQNPIPSVAPLSNMNEEMASLFVANNTDEKIFQESNTNPFFSKENDSFKSSKFVWQGLEDDLLEGKWSLKHSVKFLRLYGVHRCLWDLNDSDYRSRPLRNAAIEDIAASMGHGLTASYVAKKIKIFRITYMQQRKRLLEATEKGEKPEILLKWFPLADSFLRPHIGLRSIKPDAKEMPQFDFQYVYSNLNLIDPSLLTDFCGKGTQNAIEIGKESDIMEMEGLEGCAEVRKQQIKIE